MTVYALLVGIDKYAASPMVRNLNGCVRDVERFAGFLQERVIPKTPDGETVTNGHLDLKMLRDKEATRRNILDTFREHLGQAQNGDVALFYYSGHGSQEQAPPEFWEIEPDRKNETIVCHDSRMDADSWDLADKELGYLIEQISKGKPDLHTLVILDSCHSGSGTRDADGEGVRMNPADTRTRRLDSYEIDPTAISATGDENWYQPPEGKHILMAACRPEQLARERLLGGEMRGLFSYHLIKALTGAGPNLTYRELSKHLSAMVRLLVKDQLPQIEATKENLNQPFLGGQIQPKQLSYTATFDTELDGWIIDGGTIHGISSVTQPETTELALFPTISREDKIDLSKAKGAAKVTQVFPTYSRIEGSFDDGPLVRTETYQAIVTATPMPPLLVRTEGDADRLDPVKNALSLLVKFAETDDESKEAQLRLVALANEQLYRISRTSDPNSLVVDTAFAEPEGAELVVNRLEHMAHWLNTSELANPHTSLPDDTVSLEVTIVEGTNERLFEGGGDLRLNYTQVGGEWKAPRLRFKLVNHTTQGLSCALLNLTPDYRVWPVSSDEHDMTVQLPSQSEAWVVGGGCLKLTIEDDLWQQGLTEKSESFKLIISTNKFDAGLLEQDELPVQYVGTRGDRDALGRLMKKVGLRAALDDEDPIFSDWRTVDLSVTVVRPQGAQELGDKSVELGDGVILTTESKLSGSVSLMADPEASRDLGSLALPNWLHGNATETQPFSLTATRSIGQPGLSVLALDNVENYESVTRDTPVKLVAPVTLAQNEQLLPFGFDGEFYLPLGRASRVDNGTEITIERLPAPGPTRSLTNSIRIYFQKVIADKLGLEPKYPRLAMVTPGDEEDRVNYDDDPATITKAVNEAKRILLYVHGIIGETKYMTPSAWAKVDDRSLDQQYDLVLAFDYENLVTGIGKTGQELRDKLSGVGLGPGHGKTLHLFAHSMGGLVSRWMIEHVEGGREMVQHLFMFGTPNGGSPWPKIEDYAITLLTIGLNSLAPITWPVSVLTGLLTVIEKHDKMLDEMALDSELIEALAASQDPGLPYTIFAGNTSIIETARQPEDDGESIIQRLLKKINVTKLMHDTTSLAFFNQPNDVAVSVRSVHTITDARNPKPAKHEVACDHMTYFSSAGGLPAVIALINDDGVET